MTSLTSKDLFETDRIELVIPERLDEMTRLEAALAYSQCGWFLAPIIPNSANAGSVLHKNWPSKTIQNESSVRDWFGDNKYDIALHVGRSGALAIDVDNPELLQEPLLSILKQTHTPFQSTRSDGSLRGHYVFALPVGKKYGNSNGLLGTAWGEIRGKNGIILAAPSLHRKGGKYRWVRTGVLRPLPQEIQKMLHPLGNYSAVETIGFPEVEEWISSHNSGTQVGLLSKRLEDMEMRSGTGSRHEACRQTLIATMKDVRAGLYPAIDAINEVLAVFLAKKPIGEWTSPHEYQDIVKWVIGVIKSIPQDEIDSHAVVQGYLNSPEVMNWARGSHVK